jgi:hypothetical protein
MINEEQQEELLELVLAQMTYNRLRLKRRQQQAPKPPSES